METVVIVVHMMVVLALVGVVLLQRSEGGGLGIGGGSGFMTARGAANALTRATAILAAAFFVTSLGLSIMARYGENETDILDTIQPTTSGPQVPGGGVLDQLGGSTPPAAPAVPTTEAPAPAAPTSNQTAAPTTSEPAAPAANEPAVPAPTTPIAPLAPVVPAVPSGQ